MDTQLSGAALEHRHRRIDATGRTVAGDRPRILPIRSISNIRGDMLDEVEEATSIGLDALFIDLEEPRTPFTEADRRVVRTQVGTWLREHEEQPGEPRFFARVQGAHTGQTMKDLDAIICPMLSGIMLPKVETPADIIAVDSLLTALEDDHGMAAGSVVIYPILETAQGIRNAYHLVKASPRVQYMGGAVSKFGDIVQELGYRWTPGGEESFMFRSQVLIDCKAAGMPYPITGPSQHATDDLPGLRRWAIEGRNLGYRGSQVRGVASHVALMNEVYSPTAEEVAYWRELVRLADEAGPDHDEPLLYGDLNQGEGHVLHPAHIGSARIGLQWAADLEAAAALRAATTTKGSR